MYLLTDLLVTEKIDLISEFLCTVCRLKENDNSAKNARPSGNIQRG